MFLILFVAVVVPLFTAAADPPPQSCTSIVATKYDYYFGNSDNTINVYLNLRLFKLGNTTYIRVSNVSYTSTDGRVPSYICANVPFDVTEPDPQRCSIYINTTFTFSLQEPTFYLHGRFDGYWDEIFFGYADDGTFSNGDGSLLSSAQPSYSSTFSNRNSQIIDTQNCTAFVSAPVAPKAPRCSNFESKTVILNLADNSTYATSFGRYSFFSGNNMNGNANFTGPSDFFVAFYVNGQYCDSKYANDCEFQVLDGDGKIIINSNIVKLVGTEDIGKAIPLLGRIIIRDDETLMAEGIPFTPSNACLYTSFKFGDTQISKNQFCCTEFLSA